MEISDFKVVNKCHNVAIPTKQAVAAMLRNRFNGRDVVKSAQFDFDLTPSEARGASFGQASQNTIDKITSHPAHGFDAELAIAGERRKLSGDGYLEAALKHVQGRAEFERRRHEDSVKATARLRARLDDYRNSRGPDLGRVEI